jgi:CRISPR-associated protein Cmr2
MRYIGLTIGPIDKTLAAARKTRELWGASYLFSYMMKEIIDGLLEKGINKENIIIPYAGDLDNRQYAYGAGIYPDRLIFRADENEMRELMNTIDEVSWRTAGKIAGHIKKDTPEVAEDIENYFHFHAVETAEIKASKNPILEISPALETLDLEKKYIYHDDNAYLSQFLHQVNNSFLYQEAFKDPITGNKQKERFESLIEIGTVELEKHIPPAQYKDIISKSFQKKKPEINEETVIRELKKALAQAGKEKLFKTCHKYTAIVRADGDNIGNLLETMGNDTEAIKRFSRHLKTFAQKAAGIIHQFGGTPVYAGGDDLLFFAPLVNTLNPDSVTTQSTIFDLIDTLDNEFKKYFDTITLSYGVSITYYKFPLKEALETAQFLLFDRAKNIAGKNAIAFQVLKHSGKTFGAAFKKETGIYSQFKRLLRQFSQIHGEMQYLNSIVYTAERYKHILNHIGKDLEKVANFFKNAFDEKIHQTYETFIETAAKLFYQVYNESPPDWGDDDKYNSFYTALRMLHFLNCKDTEDRP